MLTKAGVIAKLRLVLANLDTTGMLLVGVVGLALVFQLIGVFRLPINWDEFYNLNLVYKFSNDEITNKYQTMILRVFHWVLLLPASEINQIIAARIMMFCLAVLTCFFIFKTCRRFTSINASLYAVLAYLSFYFVLLHLTSFRVDGIVTAILMSVLWIVTNPSQSTFKTLIAGGLIGLAGAFSFKSIFYMPIVATFLIARWRGSNWSWRYFNYGLAMFVTALVSFTLIYTTHGAHIDMGGTDKKYLSHLLQHGFSTGEFGRKVVRVLFGVKLNPLLWVFIIYGVFAVFASNSKNASPGRIKGIKLLSFLFPLSTFAFYAQAAPYYYQFVLAPTVVVVAIAADRYLNKKRKLPFEALVFFNITVLILGAGLNFTKNQKYQREIVENIHRIFPSPVAYLDYCGMIPSYNRIIEPGLFINPDALNQQDFLFTAPVMRDILVRYKPNFFISNISALDLEGLYRHPLHLNFLPEDDAVLRDNFIRFWGPIYIPGKRLHMSDDSAGHSFEIIIDGTYTLSGSDSVLIDGVHLSPRESINLSSGMHVASGVVTNDAVLEWGTNLERPEEPSRPKQLFLPF